MTVTSFDAMFVRDVEIKKREPLRTTSAHDGFVTL